MLKVPLRAHRGRAGGVELLFGFKHVFNGRSLHVRLVTLLVGVLRVGWQQEESG